MLEKFLQAIYEKRYLSVDFISKEDDLLRNKKCVSNCFVKKICGIYL